MLTDEISGELAPFALRAELIGGDTLNLTVSDGFGAGEFDAPISWEFLGLDWNGGPGGITGVQRIGGNGGMADASVTDSSVSITTPMEFRAGAPYTYSFRINPAQVEEPTTLALWGSTLAPFRTHALALLSASLTMP
ncbi:MAG: hypothetical protein AAGA68_10630 [Pseudomonadota bacterium]